MLSGFYLKKFIVKVSVKRLETHFSLLSLIDPLLIQVLNIVVDLVLLVLLLHAMIRGANDASRVRVQLSSSRVVNISSRARARVEPTRAKLDSTR